MTCVTYAWTNEQCLTIEQTQYLIFIFSTFNVSTMCYNMSPPHNKIILRESKLSSFSIPVPLSVSLSGKSFNDGVLLALPITIQYLLCAFWTKQSFSCLNCQYIWVRIGLSFRPRIFFIIIWTNGCEHLMDVFWQYKTGDYFFWQQTACHYEAEMRFLDII
jgi:hypothetical protein